MRFAGLLLLTLLFAGTAFAQINYTKTGYSPFAFGVSTGDFDRDGRPDVAGITNDANGNASLVIFRGGTGGSLIKKAQYPFNNNFNPAWTYTADVNNDGKLDIIVVTQYADAADIWLGNGDATFRYVRTQTLAIGTQSLTLGDFNGDGKIDIADFFQDDTSSGFQVLLGNGDGTFVSKSFVEGEFGAANGVIADFNKDGKLDALLRVRDNLELFLGAGDGTFSTTPVFTPFTLPQGRLIAGSFNRDTALDLAFRVSACNTCATDTIYVLLNDGAGHFSVKSTNHVGLSQVFGDLTAGDLNNDGVQDIVWANSGQTGTTLDNAVRYILNKGDGTFGDEFTATTMAGGTATPVLRHLNLDSQLDMLAPSGKLYTLLATNAPTNCTPPGTASLKAKICIPGSGATVSNTFTVKAAGDSPAGVSRMQLFVDGKKVYDVWSDQLRKTVTVGSGTHRVTVRAYDKYVGNSQTSINVSAN